MANPLRCTNCWLLAVEAVTAAVHRVAWRIQTLVWVAKEVNFPVKAEVGAVAVVVVASIGGEVSVAETSSQNRTYGRYSTAVFGVPSVVSCQFPDQARPGNRLLGRVTVIAVLPPASHRILKTVVAPAVPLPDYIYSTVPK